MSEKLISAEYLFAKIDKFILECDGISFEELRKVLKSAPAVDAVEVVRCKDCKYWVPMDIGGWMTKGRVDGECRLLLDIHSSKMYMTKKDHFCSYGRKERRQ